ncbi:GUN4 domain-containing protein [Phormidium sp. CLA17]|uniref:GUN4 domain-containing protein n=1 Tax=Leptolyngbya sp. Cla-17 TaxID=2803751 RepID=UPI001492BDD8|nr:GUN4 domain-containing protein [Leptolyngbya sp. Cla-17]MBM0743120.1 GUN4 domain-containing protein [Leptolyngbya sp. Cla-17]
MKRVIALGFLACLIAGSVTPPFFGSKQSRADEALTASPTVSSAVPRSDVFYLSDRFGFRIVSPRDYTITPSETKPSTQPAIPIEVLELWQQADFLNRDSLPQQPPIISITVYNNNQRLPLTHWKGELSRQDDRPLTVAGQNAIAYTSTGLYNSDNVLFGSPDGRYIVRLTAGYLDAKAPIRQTFQELVSNFSFDVKPAPKSATKWQINYSRLQSLLAAKNWQAADLETRAILQRLAGSQGDLLFSSKSVLSRISLTDLRTLDTLWSKASSGRFGFSAQHRIWQQVAKGSKNSKAQTERFAQIVGWRRTQPLPEDNPVGMELSGTGWRLDTELNYTTAAPTGHFPWAGVSSGQLTDLLNGRSLGCGSCTTDAIYLVSDRYDEYLPALFARFKQIGKQTNKG